MRAFAILFTLSILAVHVSSQVPSFPLGHRQRPHDEEAAIPLSTLEHPNSPSAARLPPDAASDAPDGRPSFHTSPQGGSSSMQPAQIGVTPQDAAVHVPQSSTSRFPTKEQARQCIRYIGHGCFVMELISSTSKSCSTSKRSCDKVEKCDENVISISVGFDGLHGWIVIAQPEAGQLCYKGPTKVGTRDVPEGLERCDCGQAVGEFSDPDHKSPGKPSGEHKKRTISRISYQRRIASWDSDDE
ncbi:uncharacterized protein C8R40DRAFT_1075141 [Lentinula edodes]|uniref:uncharacterized protein n=1 Tax=Lentinula edodes TaxID=5353 RepID=UPI001E8EE8EC|nr:uncharacterized protein C8R40DRAFT_1075141 [Lentinula edodes]KAH7868077.1 hypothetical protein C8R40DRAFT_1075141 [Lentinula edodes]